jgi:hypothetical protein
MRRLTFTQRKEQYTMAKTATKSKASKKTESKAPVEETEELEEIEGDEAADTKSKKSDDVVFGASDLAKLLSEKSGKTVSPRELRTLIRKMARDGSGRVNREIKAGNRTRYNWSGPEDPEVQKIIAAFDGGELEADKQAKLAELKEKKAAKKKDKDKAEGKKGGKGKGKKAEPVAEADSDDDEDLDLDED